jgi:hypothetical protein
MKYPDEHYFYKLHMLITGIPSLSAGSSIAI